MKSFQTIIAIAAIAAIALLSACSTVMTSAKSGYLSDYGALVEAPDAASASRASAQAIDPIQVSIAEVVWRVDSRTDIGKDERDALLAQLKRELQQGVLALPASPQGRPVQIRAAITRVETVSPALNTVSSLLLFVPLDRGGAALEIEALDLQTGRQLAALRLGYFAPLSELKARFSKLAPAEIAVSKAAGDFVSLLNPVPDADKKTAQR
ncbi:DUF3313 domain-containing protein [Paucibacter sp. B2R-40]|uniref:DUF3313 domain-containing protein n=1 Tax=Paucibacter sp. B2R-40 TaxID=2893554 RepID=UPI0021E4084B|nr:DUF3313 domain-containing protein [Paucibacter sp. B2R-40]MCV2355698.1 DUF3313 domain-containing protein [Paucibacter sp. B2R-40]